ncbi:hypothetical protein D3C76_1366810 [compost metagenome]
MLGAIILVRCVPDRPAGTQQLEHAAHVLALHRQGIQIVPLATATLHIVEQRVLVFAVHAVDGVLLAEQRRTDFQRGEVDGHQDHALALTLGILQVLQAFDMGQFRQPLA